MAKSSCNFQQYSQPLHGPGVMVQQYLIEKVQLFRTLQLVIKGARDVHVHVHVSIDTVYTYTMYTYMCLVMYSEIFFSNCTSTCICTVCIFKSFRLVYVYCTKNRFYKCWRAVLGWLALISVCWTYVPHTWAFYMFKHYLVVNIAQHTLWIVV